MFYIVFRVVVKGCFLIIYSSNQVSNNFFFFIILLEFFGMIFKIYSICIQIFVFKFDFRENNLRYWYFFIFFKVFGIRYCLVRYLLEILFIKFCDEKQQLVLNKNIFLFLIIFFKFGFLFLKKWIFGVVFESQD